MEYGLLYSLVRGVVFIRSVFENIQYGVQFWPKNIKNIEETMKLRTISGYVKRGYDRMISVSCIRVV